jgi:hypothetical protein
LVIISALIGLILLVFGALDADLNAFVAASVFFAGATAGAFLWFAPLARHNDELAEARSRDAVAREELWRQHMAARVHWQRQVDAQHQAEHQRLITVPLWYPLQPQTTLSRLDVYGGTTESWACFLTTLGGPNLAANHRILLLDLTEGDVGDGLLTVADRKGLAARRYALPSDLHVPTLLGGLDGEELAELLADAFGSTGLVAEARDVRSLHVHILRIVIDCLEQPATFARIAAGLRILQRRYDAVTAGPLTTEEQHRLAEQVDAVGQSERTQNELQTLDSLTELLARQEASVPPEDQYLSFRTALTVLATVSSNPRRKDLTDAILFHTILHHLRAGTGRVTADLVVIAGADRIGKDALESMARHARRRRVRVIYLLEHLRDDINQIIGGSDSAAVIMRLGNPEEAATAARFIGHEHKFVVSQETKGFGETITVGAGSSYGETYGESHGSSSGAAGGSSSGTSSSRSWQRNDNWSRATSTNYGLTNSRVYEFRVEPSTIQALPVSAFILIDTGPLGRRANLGDCNPGIAALPRVSRLPRTIAR